nr:unnamed protein product [Callosobruchus analis]
MASGNLILADKGFLIADILPQGVSLSVPPVLTTPQFTPQQVVKTRTIARAKIHVERAIKNEMFFNFEFNPSEFAFSGNKDFPCLWCINKFTISINC